MRGFLLVGILLGALWAVDSFAFDGRYGRAVWAAAKVQGSKIRSEVNDFLKRAKI
jgi:nitrate reductase NapE component